jgi:hypothetical protein
MKSFARAVFKAIQNEAGIKKDINSIVLHN